MGKKLVLAALALLWLAPLQAAENLHDGEFFFGVYSANPYTDQVYSHLKEIGIDYVHTYGAYHDDPPTKILDLAQQHGLKVMYDIGGKRDYMNPENPEWKANVQRVVDQVKDHPALGFWYLWDEPDTKNLPQLKELNALVKASSTAPTSIVIHERAEYWNTRGYSDIWMVDGYPVRGQPFPTVKLDSHFSRLMRNAGTGYKYENAYFVPVLQMCDFSCFKDQAPAEHRETLRYPNEVEMRHMMFSSLCYGSRGMLFFSYWHAHRDRPAGRAFFDGVFTPLLAEAKAFTGAVPKIWEVTSRDTKLDNGEKVSLAYWHRPGAAHMILVNNTPETRDLSVDTKPYPVDGKKKYRPLPKRGTLKPWGRTAEKPAKLQNGVITVANAEPWEVFVWEVN